MPHTNAGSFIQGLASKITTHFDTFILDAGWSQEKKMNI
jgi:hypothetical protein